MSRRREAFPDWTKGQISMPPLSAAEAWAREVKCGRTVMVGKGADRERVKVLNPETRRLLIALAGAVKPGASIALMTVADLQARSRLEGRRLVWWLSELNKAGLVGEARVFQFSDGAQIQIPLLMEADDMARKAVRA